MRVFISCKSWTIKRQVGSIVQQQLWTGLIADTQQHFFVSDSSRINLSYHSRLKYTSQLACPPAFKLGFFSACSKPKHSLIKMQRETYSLYLTSTFGGLLETLLWPLKNSRRVFTILLCCRFLTHFGILRWLLIPQGLKIPYKPTCYCNRHLLIKSGYFPCLFL